MSTYNSTEIQVNKKTLEPRVHEEYVGGDGDIDRVFHFGLDDTSLICDSAEGVLMGQIFDGQALKELMLSVWLTTNYRLPENPILFKWLVGW